MKTKHSEPITRDKHLAWCKLRALQELQLSSPRNAVALMLADLGGHMETAGHICRSLGVIKLMCGELETDAQARKFIEGFN